MVQGRLGGLGGARKRSRPSVINATNDEQAMQRQELIGAGPRAKSVEQSCSPQVERCRAR